jgi:hypothetical protein
MNTVVVGRESVVRELERAASMLRHPSLTPLFDDGADWITVEEALLDIQAAIERLRR